MSTLSRCSSLAWRTDDSGAHFTRTGELLLRTRTSKRHAAGQDGRDSGGGGGCGRRRVGGRGRDSYTQFMMVNTTRTIRGHRARHRGRFCVSQPCTVRFYVVQMCSSEISPRFPVERGRKLSTRETINARPSSLIRSPFFSFLILFPSRQSFHLLKRFSFFALTPKKPIYFSFRFFLLFSHIPCTSRGPIHRCNVE